MRVEGKNILRLVSEFENINNKKLDEWFSKTKNHLPVYVAEYLFMKKSGVVSQMMYSENESGLVYDPTLLRQGIDCLMAIMEGQNYGHDTARLKFMYLNFTDAGTRFLYLKPFIDQLEILPTISEEIIADVKSLLSVAQNSEEVELLEKYIKSIESRKKIQAKELEEKLAKQKH